MRLALLCALLVAPALAPAATPERTAFPMPAVDGKPLAMKSGQTVFSLPIKFGKVEAFYREQFKDDPKITFKASAVGAERLLTLESKRANDAWAKAVLKDGEVTTSLTVTFLIRPDGDTISGKMPPVMFIIGRSNEVVKAAESIDHMEKK